MKFIAGVVLFLLLETIIFVLLVRWEWRAHFYFGTLALLFWMVAHGVRHRKVPDEQITMLEDNKRLVLVVLAGWPVLWPLYVSLRASE